MRILFLTDDASPAYGCHLQVIGMRDGFRRLGHDARLFSSNISTLVDAKSLADYQCRGSSSRLSTLLQTANPWAYAKLRRVLAEFRPHVVHVRRLLSQLSPLILPLLRNVPSVYHPGSYRSICPRMSKMLPNGRLCTEPSGLACLRNGCLPWYALPPHLVELGLFRRYQHIFKANIAISEAVRQRLFADSCTHTEVIWHSVPGRPARPPLTTPPTVAYAGRLVWNKGVHVLLRAFCVVVQAVPAARLLLLGDGPAKSELQKLASELEIDARVTFAGHVPRAEVERRFNSVWVQVVPSLWEEPFGLVAPEAMMRGSALIVSNRGGLAETVQHEHNGFQVPAGDVEALVRTLQPLLQDRERAEDIGRVARIFALEHFDEDRYLQRLLQLYRCIGASG
jgi:glycosyltransferase involved in cell wall biosynthesis